MAKKKKGVSKKQGKPRVHKDLDGFEVSIDTFGEIKANINIEKINQFLDKNVEDKKLVERDETIAAKRKSKKKKGK